MRKISIISVILIAMLVLGACNSSSENSSKSADGESSAFAASLKAAEDAKSYKFTATVEIKGNIFGKKPEGEIKMSGASNADGSESVVVVDLSPVLSELDNLAGSGLDASELDLELEQRTIDGVGYTKNLDFFGLDEDTWTEQDLSELLKSNEAQNPNLYLQYLQAEGADVEKVGTEKVNGVNSTHYRAEISAEKMKEYFESDAWKQYFEEQGISDSDYEDLKSEYTKKISKTSVDLWIDEDDLPVKMKISTSISSGLFAGGTDQDDESLVESVITIDFSDWGTDIEVEAPPADQIVTKEEYEQKIKDKLLSQLGA